VKRSLFISLLCSASASLCAQQITPFVISSGGTFGNTGGIILSWTLGETFGTTIDNGSNKITQGFHQPLNMNDSIIVPIDTSGFIPTGISPNGDGFNDSWVIDDSTANMKNVVYIFNRWGDLVWRATDYNNTSVVWRGDNQAGVPLSSSTYFYVIVKGDKTEKGWVEVTK